MTHGEAMLLWCFDRHTVFDFVVPVDADGRKILGGSGALRQRHDCSIQRIRRPQRKHSRSVVLHGQLLIPKKRNHPVVKPEASGRPLRVEQPYVDPCISDFAPQLLSVFLTSSSASGRLNNTLLTYYIQSAVKVILQSPHRQYAAGFACVVRHRRYM